MSDTNAPERFTMDAVTDGERAWCVADPHPEGEWVRWSDLATPAPREDGYSAGVRAAAEVANAVYHTCVEDAAELTAIKIRGRILALLDAPALPDARSGAAEPVAWTGSGSLMALQDGREGFIWPVSADAHPIPLYAAPPTPACTATDGPASACVYRAPGLGTAADWERG